MPFTYMAQRCLLVFALFGLSASSHADSASPTPTKVFPVVSPEKKMVWAHSMMSFPLELNSILPYVSKEIGYEAFGATYPLLQEIDLQKRTGRSWTEIDLEQAKAAGIDGLSVDVFTSNAEEYLKAANKIGGIVIAPCLDLSIQPPEKKEAAAIKTVIQNCQLAERYKSAAKIGDATLIFTYGTEQLSPDAWLRVRQAVAAAGFKTYWVVSVDTDGKLVNPRGFPRQAIKDVLRPFEAGYLFGNPHGDIDGLWNQVRATFADEQKPFYGGMSQGYFRQGAGYIDAQCTATYREMWRLHLRDRTPWAAISTWNDYQETTSIGPSADFNFTLAELTKWFSAKFKGERPDWKDPHLYITTPKSVYLGQEYRIEALTLNPTKSHLTVSVQLLDNTGRKIGQPIISGVAPGQENAATLTGRLSALPTGHFWRARATLRDGQKVLNSVVSAPILTMDSEAQPGFERTLYYSIPAHKALSGEVVLKLSGLPTQTPIDCVVLPPSGSQGQNEQVRSAEVLQNTVLAKNFFNQRPFEVMLPRRDASGAIPGGSTWGFYVARVVSTDFRVGYSDPIYVAPPGDVSVKERFDFNLADATQAPDSSVFGGRMRMDNVALTSDDNGGKAASFSANSGNWSNNSPRNLDSYRTPTGPVEITMRVRPQAYGGIFYGDTGGLWISTNTNGTLNYTRLRPGGGWSAANGKTPLPLNQWSRIKATWDGKISRIYLNDQLEAEIEAAPAFKSERRALGYNPYSGKERYAGDIDDFCIRSLSFALSSTPQ